MIELIVWIIAPLLLSLGLLTVSVGCCWMHRAVVQFALALVVGGLTLSAVMMLVMMAGGAMATLLPHAFILLSVPLVAWQVIRMFAAA